MGFGAPGIGPPRPKGFKGIKGKKFKPFKAPTRPPSNTYDPNLDAQQRAAQRGFQDLQADTALAGGRALEDYGLGVQNLQQARARGLADIATAETGVRRDFSTLATAQAGQQRSAGVSGGGTALAAAAARAQNQQLALDPLQTQRVRLNENTDAAIGAAGVDYTRGVTDRTTALDRAGRENTFFGQDIGAQRFYQARGTGYIPPTRPKGERTVAGLTVKLVKGKGANRVYNTAGGRLLTRSQFVKEVNARRKKGKK